MPCSYFKVILEIYFKINNCGPCFQSHPAAGGTCGCCLLSILVNPVPPTSVLLAFGGCKGRWTITPPLCKLLLHLCLNSDNCKGKKSCALGGKTDWEAACSSFLSAAVIKHCDHKQPGRGKGVWHTRARYCPLLREVSAGTSAGA